MKCYYCKKTGTKLEIGKPYLITIDHDLGSTTISGDKLSLNDLEKFVKFGIISVKDVYTGNAEKPSEYDTLDFIDHTMDYWKNKLINKYGDSVSTIYSKKPYIYRLLMIGEIAQEFNKLNRDDIKTYTNVFVIDISSNSVVNVNSNTIDFNLFPVFRTIKEANFAKDLTLTIYQKSSDAPKE